MNNEEYKIMYIPKAKGYRKIVTYSENGLKIRKYHSNLSKIIYNNTLPSKFSKAYIRKRSIITNAKSHIHNDIFIYFDIKDFFQSINHEILTDILYYEINKNNKKNIRKSDCNRIVKSCSLSNKGLGVGLIPSPILSNLYLKQYDNILYGKLKKLDLPNIIYTRYADDMVISFKKVENYNIEEIENLVKNLLNRFGLKLNNKKTKIINLDKSNHVRITGINISKDEYDNRKLTVGRKRKNQLYYDAIALICKNQEERDSLKIKQIKGNQSFILSVEGKDYEDTYSSTMKSLIETYGFKTLKDLIDSL